MILVVRFFPEIIIKSRDVRQRYIAVLRRSLRTQLNLFAREITIAGGWDSFNHDEVSIVERIHKGLGGYPLGTQDAVLSLISGGFDSTVSSYQCIKRGMLTHFCFFRLGGAEHELAVKEVALYLWLKYGASHRVKFITIPFEEVVEEIVAKEDNSQMGVVFKRMMYRAAAAIADILKIDTLVTGESVAQVASQTLANLAIINRAGHRHRGLCEKRAGILQRYFCETNHARA